MTPEELANLKEKMKKGEKLTDQELESLSTDESTAKEEKKNKKKFRISRQDVFGDFYESIKEVIVRKSKLTSEPTEWEFYINDRVVKVDGKNINVYKIFSNAYINEFLTPPPYLKNETWNDILTWLKDDGKVRDEEKSKDSDESDNEYIANRVFEKICKLSIVGDDSKAEAGVGRALYEYQGYYCLPSKDVDKIVDSTNCHITKAALLKTMTELGMKKGGTTNVRYGEAGQYKSFWFVKSNVDEMKGGVN